MEYFAGKDVESWVSRVCDDMEVNADYALSRLDEIQPVNLSPRETGKWINGVCHNCGKRPDDLRRGTELEYSYWEQMPPYCPNCGRRMTLERWSNGD